MATKKRKSPSKKSSKKRSKKGLSGTAKGKSTQTAKKGWKAFGSETLKALGFLSLGTATFGGANLLSKSITNPKTKKIVQGSLAVTSLGGSAALAAFKPGKMGWLKTMLLVIGVYNTVALLGAGTEAAVQGLSGMPEGVKNTLRKIFPPLGEVDGAEDTLSNIEQEMMGLAETDPELFGRLKRQLNRGGNPATVQIADRVSEQRPKPGVPANLLGLGNIQALV